MQGYAVNKTRLAQKQQEVQVLKDGIRILNRAIEGKIAETELDWLAHFAKGLELLDDYDHEQLDDKGLTKRSANYPESVDYKKIIDIMRADTDSAIFGKEKDGSFQSAKCWLDYQNLRISPKAEQIPRRPRLLLLFHHLIKLPQSNKVTDSAARRSD